MKPVNLLAAAITNAPHGQALARTRNWHDKMMAYNKGRGFDMVFTPLPDDPYTWDSHTYKDGHWQAKKMDMARPASVPPTFGNFTGTVEGLVGQLDGDFVAQTFYNEKGLTPTHTYMEAVKLLDKAGFLTAPFFEVEGNGWNSIKQFVEEHIETPELRGAYLGWFVLPASTRLAESAVRKGIQIASCVMPPGDESYKIGFEIAEKDFNAGELIEVTSVPEIRGKIENDPIIDDTGEAIVEEENTNRQLLFLISGRFKKTKAEIAAIIEGDGHAVSSTYQGAVDVVVVPSLNSRTRSTKAARNDGKILVTLDDLESYLENYRNQ